MHGGYSITAPEKSLRISMHERVFSSSLESFAALQTVWLGGVVFHQASPRQELAGRSCFRPREPSRELLLYQPLLTSLSITAPLFCSSPPQTTDFMHRFHEAHPDDHSPAPDIIRSLQKRSESKSTRQARPETCTPPNPPRDTPDVPHHEHQTAARPQWLAPATCQALMESSKPCAPSAWLARRCFDPRPCARRDYIAWSISPQRRRPSSLLCFAHLVPSFFSTF
jgi:hypothetical protein